MKNNSPEFIEVTTDNCYIINVKFNKELYKASMVCFLYKEQQKIDIGDIRIGYGEAMPLKSSKHYSNFINKGYGTEMMNMLLKFAKENGYKKITGILSKDDANSTSDPTHRDRQIHFYKKFGFEILPNEESLSFIKLNVG